MDETGFLSPWELGNIVGFELLPCALEVLSSLGYIVSCSGFVARPRPSQRKFKASLLGDSAVGKSSLIWGYLTITGGDFMATIGVNFYPFKFRSGRILIKDTGGSDVFSNSIPDFIGDSDIIVLVSDVARIQSLTNVESRWISIAEKAVGEAVMRLPMVLVFNKVDLADLNDYLSATCDLVDSLLKKGLNISGVFFTSVKTGCHVKSVFRKLAEVATFYELFTERKVPVEFDMPSLRGPER